MGSRIILEVDLFVVIFVVIHRVVFIRRYFFFSVVRVKDTVRELLVFVVLFCRRHLDRHTRREKDAVSRTERNDPWAAETG
jgi:hypothetical protein